MSTLEPQLQKLLNQWFIKPRGQTKQSRADLYFSVNSQIYSYVHTQQMSIVEKEIGTIQDDRALRLLKGIGMPGRLNLVIDRQQLMLLSEMVVSPRQIFATSGATNPDGTTRRSTY